MIRNINTVLKDFLYSVINDAVTLKCHAEKEGVFLDTDPLEDLIAVIEEAIIDIEAIREEEQERLQEESKPHLRLV